MAKTATKKARWTWQDDYKVELAGLSVDELYARQTAYENLNSHTASERQLECALMVRSEITRRHNTIEALINEA